MTLDLAQVPSTKKSSKKGDKKKKFLLSNIEDDAESEGADAKQVTICTSANPMPQDATMSAATQHIECIAHEFKIADIKKTPTPTEGNLVLNKRIEYFKAQGIPLSGVPMCKETVPLCPCNGQLSASATQKYIDERN